MKKAILALICMFGGICYGQQESRTFSHTLQEEIGIFEASYNDYLHQDLYNIKWINFIPAYEIGYKNKVFAKIRFKNLIHVEEEKEIWRFFAPSSSRVVEEKLDMMSLVVSYNYFSCQKHTLKAGIDFGYCWHELTTAAGNEFNDKLWSLAIEASYKYNFNPHFAVGVQGGYGFMEVKQNPIHGLLDQVKPYKVVSSASILLSYTF